MHPRSRVPIPMPFDMKSLSPDGLFPDKGADTAYRALASIDAEIAKAQLDLKAVYTNDFARRANAKYPKG